MFALIVKEALLLDQVACSMLGKPDAKTPRFTAEKVYSQGSRARRWGNKSQIRLPEGKEVGVFLGCSGWS